MEDMYLSSQAISCNGLANAFKIAANIMENILHQLFQETQFMQDHRF